MRTIRSAFPQRPTSGQPLAYSTTQSTNPFELQPTGLRTSDRSQSQRALPSRVRALYQRWALPMRIRCPATTARAWPTWYGRTTRVRIQSYANRSAYGVVVAQPLGLHDLLLRLCGHLPCLRRSPAARLPLRLPSQTRKAAYRTPLPTRTLVPSRPASRIPRQPHPLGIRVLSPSASSTDPGVSPFRDTPLGIALHPSPWCYPHSKARIGPLHLGMDLT